MNERNGREIGINERKLAINGANVAKNVEIVVIKAENLTKKKWGGLEEIRQNEAIKPRFCQ